MAACAPRTAVRAASVPCWATAHSCRRSRKGRQKRHLQCDAKKSKKKRLSERFEERPVDADIEALDEQVDNTDTVQADDTAYEVVEAEPVYEQQQYQTQAAAPSPQAPSSSGTSDLVRLGALGLGAAALIGAVVFAIKRFAKQQLPEEEKVSSTPTSQRQQASLHCAACEAYVLHIPQVTKPQKLITSHCLLSPMVSTPAASCYDQSAIAALCT